MTRTLFYDGTCGLCARSVQFILKRERDDRTIQFAPLQGETAAGIMRAHPELAKVDSIILVEEDASGHRHISTRSDAVLRILRYLGGVWSPLAAVARVLPGFIRNTAYDLVARTRYQVFGRDTACLLPTPEQRKRFLP
jgi:predicted DCC family thiol-disulfide oxidoreductase YuxK